MAFLRVPLNPGISASLSHPSSSTFILLHLELPASPLRFTQSIDSLRHPGISQSKRRPTRSATRKRGPLDNN
ncbi:uncharacterized protein TrAtP1_005130 [Trichoderma atroviride]|uniref:uncharacterized protein n=1 Tax=Hypocrea atroviridis TaxID=63577 RepID=UPI0033230389|nr:hypothetical protein TrAtP1_005130 [Trichoderma atroviride]